MKFKLVVENTSRSVIKFSASDVAQSVEVDVRTTSGAQVQTRKVWFSGWPVLQRFLLEPGARVVVGEVGVVIVADGKDAKNDFGTTYAILPNPPLRNNPLIVRYRLTIGAGERWTRGEDGVMRQVSPARGEWTGTLATGQIAINGVRPPADD